MSLPMSAPDVVDRDMMISQTQQMISQTQPMFPQAGAHCSAKEDDIVARLVSLTELDKAWDIRRDKQEMKVGRHPTCDIVLPRKVVSSVHIRIYRDKAFRFFIQQAGSNSTWFNHRMMQNGDTRTLHNGDKICLCMSPTARTVDPETGEELKPFAYYMFETMFADSMNRPPSCSPASSHSGGATPIQANGSVTGAAGATSDTDRSRWVTEDWVKDHWDTRTVLGSGNFSEVKLGLEVKTGQPRAVKVMDKNKFKQFQSKRESHLSLSSEAEVMTSMTHKGIVRCFEWFQTDHHLYLVMEMLEGGDLLQCIMDGGPFTEPQARRIFSDLCEAVDYLHNRQIVHRDLKPENILLTSRDRDDMRVKIADFGLARKNFKSQDCRTFCGTPHYFAPEVINTFRDQQNGQPAGYGTQVDMWSLGVILYILLSGISPFEEEALYEQITEGKYEFDVCEWTAVSPEAKELVRRLMTVNPKDRLTIKQAREHKWFRFAPDSHSLRRPASAPDPPPELCMGPSHAKKRRTMDEDADMSSAHGKLGA